MKKQTLEEISKRRGFFWKSSSIYGGISGFYDYGHLGASMKRKWENLWRSYFLSLNENFVEIQPSVIMPRKVFIASGHLENFIDPVVKCTKCGNVERADQLVESVINKSSEDKSPEELTQIIKENNIRCSKCGGEFSDVEVFNLMFPVVVGAGKNKQTTYLTGETAQGAYVNFKSEFEALRRRLPMGLAVVGKAFRNEIAPRNALIRMREFTQAELQIFFDSDKIGEHEDFESVKKYKLRLFPVYARNEGKIIDLTCEDVVKELGLPKFYVYHMAKIQQFYLNVLHLPADIFRFKELNEKEKAFYNMYHWDIEIKMKTLGFKEVAGIHYRTDHDLSGHQNVSHESMMVTIDGKKIMPHVLELSFGVDRNIYAILDYSFDVEKERDVLRLPKKLSPFDVAVFPLVKDPQLLKKAKELRDVLRKSGFSVFYDESGSIGRRYRRMDEIGVSAALTIDTETIDDNTVTLRDRDTMNQYRVQIENIVDTLKQFLDS